MFTGLVLTDKGISMLTDMLNGESLEFTCIKLGDGNKPEDASSLTDLVSVRQTLPIARNSAVDEVTTLIGANLYGNSVEEGFYWREVGIFAKSWDGVEYLFSYDNAGDNASYIPAGGAVTEQLIDLNLVLGNTDNVSIVMDDSLAYATLDAMKAADAAVKSELTTLINTNINSVLTALANHTSNTSNPHSVTKSQVGLGNVANYGTATQAEAMAGTAADKFMTPARVREALVGMGVISDGNIIIKIGSTQPAVQSGKTIIWINTGS